VIITFWCRGKKINPSNGSNFFIGVKAILNWYTGTSTCTAHGITITEYWILDAVTYYFIPKRQDFYCRACPMVVPVLEYYTMPCTLVGIPNSVTLLLHACDGVSVRCAPPNRLPQNWKASTAMSNNNNNNNNNDDISRDDEGLLTTYDVVICGTGLVASILASALARAGKSVLHCDARGYYGELDAVLSLPYVQHGSLWEDQHVLVVTNRGTESSQSSETKRLFLSKPSLRLHSKHDLKDLNLKIAIGTSVETPYGSGVVMELASNKAVISLHKWTLANGTSPTLSVGIPEHLDVTLETFLATKCRIRPTLLVQAEHLLQHLSRSFALDVTPSLIFGSGPAVSGFLMSNVSEYLEFKPIEGMLWLDNDSSSGEGKLSRVPCSKGDVFASKLLNPLEKRKLMKFLQLVMDFAISEQAVAAGDEEDVSVSEELQSLNERQLNQGRSLSRPQNKAVKTDDLATLKEAVESDEIDFETYLTEKQKLSPSLKSLVRHALALEITSKSLSIGNGMRRLCQHLQGLGKFGSTAFLVPLYGSGEFPQAFCRSAAVHGGTYLLRREPKSVELTDGCVTGVVIAGSNDESGDKTVACMHVIVPANTTLDVPSKHLLRRVSIVSDKIVEDVDAQRHIILIPPNSKLGNENAIHGIVLDHTVKVVPPNCSLLHLTTTVEGEIDDSLLEQAMQALLPANAVELFHISFSYALHDDVPAENITGLHICRQTGQTLASDDAFVLAKDIFDKICPDVEFLALSEKMDNAIKENLAGREEEDEERVALDKAAELLHATMLDSIET
jgi:RAB protein geranylgeranyltransferase component A